LVLEKVFFFCRIVFFGNFFYDTFFSAVWITWKFWERFFFFSLSFFFSEENLRGFFVGGGGPEDSQSNFLEIENRDISRSRQALNG